MFCSAPHDQSLKRMANSCIEMSSQGAPRGMSQDLLPDIQLGRPSHSAENRGISDRSGTDALPLALCSLRYRTSTGLRKGFLGSSAQPRQQGGASEPRSCGLTAIKPSKKNQQGPSIPDFLKVPLTEAEQKVVLYRDMLQEVMQPDEVTLRRILEDSTVMEGFNDPAVMSAVAEIADNPEAYSKHAAKVDAFYKRMGAIVAPKLQRAAVDITSKP